MSISFLTAPPSETPKGDLEARDESRRYPTKRSTIVLRINFIFTHAFRKGRQYVVVQATTRRIALRSLCKPPTQSPAPLFSQSYKHTSKEYVANQIKPIKSVLVLFPVCSPRISIIITPSLHFYMMTMSLLSYNPNEVIPPSHTRYP